MTSRMICAYCSYIPIIAGLSLTLPSTLRAATPAPPNAAAQGAKPTPTPAHSAPSAGTSAIVVDDSGVQTLLGLPVQTSKGENVGRVVDVVVDRGGALLAAIVDFGGFLGVGSRKIAVDWRMLHFPKTDGMGKLVADLPFNHLRDAPVYKPGEPIVIMGAPAPPAAPAPKPSPSPATTPVPSPTKP